MYRLQASWFTPRNDAGGYIVNRPRNLQLLNGQSQCVGHTVLAYDGQPWGDPYGVPYAPLRGAVTSQSVSADASSCHTGYLTTLYDHDDWGNQNRVTDPRGYTTITCYDTTGTEHGCTSTTTWPRLYAYPLTVDAPDVNGHGFVTSYVWSHHLGQVETVTGPNGAATAINYRYDQWGRLVQMWKPGDSDGTPTQRWHYQSYSSATSPFRVKEEQQLRDGAYTETYTYYDGLGRAAQQRTFYYDDVANALRQAVIRTTYNALGLVERSYAPATDFIYDRFNEAAWWNDKPYTETQYDALGRVWRVTNPDGTRAWRNYDDAARVVGIVDENHHLIHHISDAFGRLVQVKEFTGTCLYNWDNDWSNCDLNQEVFLYATTHYQYEVADRLTGVTDAQGNPTTIVYDLAGRKTEMRDPDMGTWQYRYDAAGNLIKQRDARGETICFAYDAHNRLQGKDYRGYTASLDNWTCPAFDGSYEVRNSYDGGSYGRGLRTRLDDPSGWTTWSYDPRGRLTDEQKHINGVGTYFATRWSYDSADRVVTMQYPGGAYGTLGETVTHSYFLNAPQLSGVSGINAYVSGMEYNARGQLTRQSYSNNVTQLYQYHPLTGRLERLRAGTNAPDHDQRQDLHYWYDAVGNVTQIHDNYHTDQILTFTYDDLNRLHTAAAVGGDGAYPQETYNYNPLGNLTHKAGASLGYSAAAPGGCSAHTPTTKPHAVSSRVQGSAVTTYSYDCNGNLTQRARVTYPTSTTTYSYDAENRLNQVLTNGDVVATFVYDGDGNRVKQVEDNRTTYYVGTYYEMETGGTPVYRKYYYAGSQRVAMREGTSTLYYFLSDHLGSTTVTLDSTGVGNRVAELRYKPWGEQRYTWGTTPTQRRFTGQRLDSGTGLYFYNARYYDPTIGRFIQADTIVPQPGNPQSLNRYSYVYNNPLRYIDPSGHCPGPQDPSDSCWAMLGEIEQEFQIDILSSASWTTDNLSWLRQSLKMYRDRIGAGAFNSLLGGNTVKIQLEQLQLGNPGRWLNNTLTISLSSLDESTFMFTVIHELTHALVERTQDIDPGLIIDYANATGWERIKLATDKKSRRQYFVRMYRNPKNGPTMYARGEVIGGVSVSHPEEDLAESFAALMVFHQDVLWSVTDDRRMWIEDWVQQLRSIEGP